MPSHVQQQILEVFYTVNAVRKLQGLKPLRIGVNASLVAQDWSTHMANTGTTEHSLSHTTDKRLEPGFVSASENVGSNNNFNAVQYMLEQWIKSPEALANMSRPADNVMGVGIAYRQGTEPVWGTTTFYEYGQVPQKTYATAEEYLATIAPESPAVFWDVPVNSAFAEDIEWLAEQNITNGFPDGTFHPLATVSRDAMAAFLYRLEGWPNYQEPNISPFNDVSTAQQFFIEMTWLADTKITTGWPDGTFRPLDNVRRDAMAAFLYRSAGSPAYAPPQTSVFTDVSPGNQFYKEISWLADEGISTGWLQPNGTRAFAPGQAVARDAMAAFMHRFDQRGW